MNRQGSNNTFWQPGKQSRVCSFHFKDGMPTSENPYPTEHLGYEASTRNKIIIGKGRRTLVKNSPPPKKKRRRENDRNTTVEIISDDVPQQQVDVDFSTSKDSSYGDGAYDDISFAFICFYTCFVSILPYDNHCRSLYNDGFAT